MQPWQIGGGQRHRDHPQQPPVLRPDRPVEEWLQLARGHRREDGLNTGSHRGTVVVRRRDRGQDLVDLLCRNKRVQVLRHAG